MKICAVLLIRNYPKEPKYLNENRSNENQNMGKYMKSTTKQVLHMKLLKKIYWMLIIGGYLAP